VTEETLLVRIQRADPLAASAPRPHSEQLLRRVLTAARAEPRDPAPARHRRRRLAVGAAVVIVGALGAGLGLAADGWLSGDPAPPAVVTNFEGYTPQLGFHPDPGRAVRVAEDGEISLFATTNKEATYCVTVTSPWKPAELVDGGTCFPAAITNKHLVAGVLGVSASHSDGTAILVVAGRSDNPDGRRIQFTGPGGDMIERPLSRSGFFVAGVQTQMPPCARGTWKPTFSVLDADGAEVAHAAIELTRGVQGGGACVLPSLHA
jgi:hypothetical protein